MRVAVFGAKGRTGQHVVEALRRAGREVVAARGGVKLSFERPQSFQIARADLGLKVVEALEDESLVRRAPFVSN